MQWELLSLIALLTFLMTFVLDGYSAVIVRIFSHRTAGSKGNKTTCGLFAIVVNKLLKAENKVDVSI